MNEMMNIAVSINEEYIPYAYITITSIFENNRNENISVYILHGGISENALSVFDKLAQKYKQSICCIQVDQTVFGDKLPHNKEWTMEIYHRLALPELLPGSVERILYLDVDIIVIDRLCDLYCMDLHGKSIGACADMGVHGTEDLAERQRPLFTQFMKDGSYSYFNSGVLVMDISKMRSEGKDTLFFVKTGEQIIDHICGDQDILNYVYHHDVEYADANRYNIFARLSYNRGYGYEWIKKHGAIVHFAGRKPWQHEAIRYDTEKIFWEYAKLTPYYTMLLEQVLMGELESGFMEQMIRKLESEKIQLTDTLQKCMCVLKKLEINC